jgi:hypothetical protein
MAGISSIDRKWEIMDNIAVINAVKISLRLSISKAMKKVKAEIAEKRKASE